MAEELGKIEKPEAEKFSSKRKLFLVPLLYTWQGAPAEYTARFDLYWEQAGEHIANLEAKIGGVRRIFHESVTISGEEGLKIIEKLSPSSFKIARERVESGAEIEVIEDAGLVEENMDWERHLLIGFISQKVARQVAEFFMEASKKRFEYIAGRIDEAIGEDESALLFIRESHGVQFPADIEVFSVSPPALDDIHRWLRDRPLAEDTAEEETADEETGETAEEQADKESEPE